MSQRVQDSYEFLLGGMAVLMEVQDNTSSIEAMFERTRSAMTMLRRHNIVVPEALITEIEDAPEVWSGVKKLTFAFKEMLAPLEARNVVVVKEEEEVFDAEVLFIVKWV